jgi:hypothetical protein
LGLEDLLHVDLGLIVGKACVLEHNPHGGTRGTAATRLLNADLSLRQIAVLMGWSVRYAAQVIEHYGGSHL